MSIAALLSAHARSLASAPTSRATDTRPVPSAAPLTIPASSASPKLRAIVFWAKDQCLITHAPLMAAPPQ
eukprot:4012773-Alexandrium_andersonii.AAC.1